RDLPHSSSQSTGVRARSGGGRSDSRAARNASLVRPVRRASHSRDPAVPGQIGVDAALHRKRRRRAVPTALLRSVVPAPPEGGAGRDHLTPQARRDATRARSGSVGGVVLDIEGTTTPMSFVYDRLFPYARANLRRYLREHIGSAEVREAMRLLKVEYAD